MAAAHSVPALRFSQPGLENELRSEVEGVVKEVTVQEGETVETDQLLVVVEPPSE